LKRMQKERRHARINKMSSQASKKVSIIIAVTVIAILFWLSLVPWLKEGARFQHVGVWLPPFLALSLKQKEKKNQLMYMNLVGDLDYTLCKFLYK